ncbi:cation diffusion facilitator family transporter [Candidatus Nanohalococcus occultus]|uniref:cation diffusion facilitator family transporter n=1 Tax=Candidatus Nanohalococcus occultus TaxID=2978047 RepID=UPI00325F957B
MSHIPENNHSHNEKTSTKKLGVVSAINLIGFIVELIGGVVFGSIALISDAFHMLFDSLAYITAFGSAYLAENRDGGKEWSFGLHRLETLTAFFNGALLIPMAGYIIWESYQRFLQPIQIDPVPTFAIGFGGLLVNIGSVYYLQGGEMSLNEKGAFYHLLGDAGGSIAVIISTLIIYFTGFQAADPITAVLISGVIVWSAGKVLKGSTGILLQKNPLNSSKIKEEILELDEVEGVRELRIWNLCSQITVASLHVCHNLTELEEVNQTRAEIRKILSENGADHITIEMEDTGEEICKHRIEH